jgi:hypothetical protein
VAAVRLTVWLLSKAVTAGLGAAVPHSQVVVLPLPVLVMASYRFAARLPGVTPEVASVQAPAPGVLIGDVLLKL